MEASRDNEAGCDNEVEDGAQSGDAYEASAAVSLYAVKNEDGGLLPLKMAKRGRRGVRAEMSKRRCENDGWRNGDRHLHACQNESHEQSCGGCAGEPSLMDLKMWLGVR